MCSLTERAQQGLRCDTRISSGPHETTCGLTFLSRFVSKMHVSKKYGLHHCSQAFVLPLAMARGRECKKTLRGCGMQLLDPFFWGGFWPFGPSWPSCWGRGELGLCSPSVPCSSYFMAVLMHLRARVHTRVHAHVGMHTGVPCSCVCTEGAGMHGGGLQTRPPRPEPRGGKPAILCGRSPCRYNAREGIMPGLTF